MNLLIFCFSKVGESLSKILLVIARRISISNHVFRYTVEWLDDNSLELLPLESLTPFLLSYNVKYSEQCAQDYDSYQPVVDQAHTLALTVLLETETVLRESSDSSVKRS